MTNPITFINTRISLPLPSQEQDHKKEIQDDVRAMISGNFALVDMAFFLPSFLALKVESQKETLNNLTKQELMQIYKACKQFSGWNAPAWFQALSDEADLDPAMTTIGDDVGTIILCIRVAEKTMR